MNKIWHGKFQNSKKARHRRNVMMADHTVCNGLWPEEHATIYLPFRVQ